jgi:hypothetical protein
MAESSKEDKVVEFVPKPSKSGLEKFKSKRAAAVANVETLSGPLPHHSIAQAKDFVRLHPNEDDYWSAELCFVQVPIKGATRELLHLIDEELVPISYLLKQGCSSTASRWTGRRAHCIRGYEGAGGSARTS